MNSFPITTRTRETPPFAIFELSFVSIPMCAHEAPDLRPDPKRGRPRKNIDVGVLFHMIKNNAPIAVVARHLGINRDTLYVNFRSIIEEARASHRQAWKEIITPWIEERIKQRQLKREAKRIKRRYRRKDYL